MTSARPAPGPGPRPGTGTGTGIDVDAYASGVLAGSRAFIARAVTLVESTRLDHRELAQRLLLELLPHAGRSRRVGVTGVPGVGKSTFIDALGSELTAAGHRVAVLAVDPTSTRTGGSILGDKTRMTRLATDPGAFVRPSPSAGTLGGVTRATRESIVVMEAAGYDVVLVETVGVGQSETAVANMVDTFLLLVLADVVAVNKADGPHEAEARAAARELAGALRMFQPADPEWRPPVLTCSAQQGSGLVEVWERVERHRRALRDSGRLAGRREQQQVAWTWSMVREQVLARLARDPEVRRLTPEVEARVRQGSLTPTLAAEQLVRAFTGDLTGDRTGDVTGDLTDSDTPPG